MAMNKPDAPNVRKYPTASAQSGRGRARAKPATLAIKSGATRYRVARANRSEKTTRGAAAITPKAGSSAAARRSASGVPGGAPARNCTARSATNAAARPMKLQGSASRTATTKGSSPRRRMTGTARASNARKALEAADDGFDAADDLDIARVDWRHR